MAWRGVAWHGVAWRGVAWRGVAWRGLAWHGMAALPCGALAGSRERLRKAHGVASSGLTWPDLELCMRLCQLPPARPQCSNGAILPCCPGAMPAVWSWRACGAVASMPASSPTCRHRAAHKGRISRISRISRIPWHLQQALRRWRQQGAAGAGRAWRRQRSGASGAGYAGYAARSGAAAVACPFRAALDGPGQLALQPGVHVLIRLAGRAADHRRRPHRHRHGHGRAAVCRYQ